MAKIRKVGTELFFSSFVSTVGIACINCKETGSTNYSIFCILYLGSDSPWIIYDALLNPAEYFQYVRRILKKLHKKTVIVYMQKVSLSL